MILGQHHGLGAIDPIFDAARSAATTLPACSAIDCNDLISHFSSYTTGNSAAARLIPFPGMASVWANLMVPITAFSDIKATIRQAYHDPTLVVQVDSNGKPVSSSFIPKAYSPTPVQDLPPTWDTLTGLQWSLIYDSWKSKSRSLLAPKLVDKVLTVKAGTFLQTDTSKTILTALSIRDFVKANSDFTLTYQDLSTLPPTTLELNNSNGMANYWNRGGWLWSISTVRGGVPIGTSGGEACAEWCKSSCAVPPYWPNGIPICSQPINILGNPSDDTDLYWDVYFSRNKPGTTTITLVPVFPSGFEKAIRGIAGALAAIGNAFCTIGIPALTASPKLDPRAKASIAAAAQMCPGASTPYIPSVPTVILPPSSTPSSYPAGSIARQDTKGTWHVAVPGAPLKGLGFVNPATAAIAKVKTYPWQATYHEVAQTSALPANVQQVNWFVYQDKVQPWYNRPAFVIGGVAALAIIGGSGYHLLRQRRG